MSLYAVCAWAAELPRHPLELRALREPHQVLELLPTTLAAAVAANAYSEQALLQLARANACRVIADWACQRDAGLAAAIVARLAQDPLLEIRALIAEGRGRMALHDFNLAETALGRAQVMLQSHPSIELGADVDLAYSSLSHLLGKHALAVQYADQGLARLAPGQAPAMRVRLLRNRGRAEAQLGLHKQAKSSLLDAMSQMEAIGDPKLLAEIELELARLAEQTGDSHGQLQRGQRVLDIAVAIGNLQLQGMAQEMIGLAQFGAGQLPEAAKSLQAAASVFRQLAQHRDEMRVVQMQVRTALAATPKPDIELLVRRWLTLDEQVVRGDRAREGDDFEAQLRYAEQALQVQQLKATIAQKSAETEHERLSMTMMALPTLLLGGLAGLFAIQRRANQRLTASETRYRVLADTTRDLIVRMRPDGERLYVSPSAKDIIGWTPEELRVPRWELVHPDDRKQVMDTIATLATDGGTRVFTYRTQHREGHYVWIEALASRITSLERAGDVEIVYSGRDISARVRAEQDLEQSQARLRAIADHIPAMIALIDSEQRYVFANAAIGEVVGNSPQTLIGRTLRAARGELAYAAVKPHVEAVLNGELVTFEDSAMVSGRTYHYQSNYVPDRRADGTVKGFYALTFDITALKTAQLEVEAARDQLLMAADIAELGIWSWTLADNALQWNSRMFEIYGQPIELQKTGLNYEHWRSRVHPEDIESTEACLIEAVEGRGSYNTRFRVRHVDGSERVVQSGAQVERDASGKAIRVTGINRDISTQLELEDTLRSAKDDADAANRAKSEFLANMSHEIRTPMHAVLGMLELALLTGLDARQRDFVSKAQGAAHSLLGLLNDLLDFSKIDAEKLQLEEQPFELEELLRELAVVLSGSQRGSNVELLYVIDPKLPRVLIGDRQRLQQVLVNLAGNALKFTHRGHVAIGLQLLDRQAVHATLHFEIRDTGIGISEAQMQRIFQPFVQAETSTSRRFGGTGLGLVICQRLVELMGGSLRAESKAGSGSRFWFDLPIEVVDNTPMIVPTPGAMSFRVLIADDNALTAEALCQSVSALGWQAECVSGGQQAVARVLAAQQRGEPHDVVLMDWQISDLDAIAAARLICGNRSNCRPPAVIMLTPNGRELLQQPDSGSTPHFDNLSKPITPLQLAEAIRKAVTGARLPVMPEVT